ncbi:hypothetical protein N7540_011028 [Penicillium herquei]|nr:hypothetical protein N7540_011028 [Penicillium herquei]
MAIRHLQKDNPPQDDRPDRQPTSQRDPPQPQTDQPLEAGIGSTVGRNEQTTTASQRSLDRSLTLMPPRSNGPRHGPMSSVHRSNVKVGAKFANQDMTPEEFLAYFCTEASS